MVTNKFIPSTEFIEKLPNICVDLELVSVYDMDCYSVPQLLYRLAQKINDTITNMEHNDSALKAQLNDLQVKLEYLLGEGLSVELQKIFEKMYADGTLQSLVEGAMVDINKKLEELKAENVKQDERIIELKAENVSQEERLNDIDSQLEHIKSNIEININDFEREKDEKDDTGRFQRAINTLVNGGTLKINGELRITKQVVINRTGIKIKGQSNKKSKIFCDVEGVAIFVKILRNGVPYTNLGYCKFFMEDIALVAEGKSINGTGLWLQWIYGSRFQNLYTTGFKKHIVLKGSHLNSFYNLYCGGHDDSTENYIWNKGCGISADSTLDESGEWTSNNNNFIGGIFHNATFDLRGFGETKFDGLDIEPAGHTCYLGTGNSLLNLRLERFDISEINGSSNYGRFKWIEIGSDCKIKNTTFHQSGAHASRENPILDITGNGNEIEIRGNIALEHLINFGDNTKQNKIDIYEFYDIPNVEQQEIDGLVKGDNIINFPREKKVAKIPFPFGINYLANNGVDISIPNTTPSNTVDNSHYLTFKGGTLCHFNRAIFTATSSGFHTLNMWINSKTKFTIQYNFSKTGVTPPPTNGWKFISIPLMLKVGDTVNPVFGTGAGCEVSVGGIFACEGVGVPYLNDECKRGLKITTNTGALIKKGTNFTITIKTSDFSKQCCYKGYWTTSNVPTLFPVSNKDLMIELTNEQGSIGLNTSEAVEILMDYEYII